MTGKTFRSSFFKLFKSKIIAMLTEIQYTHLESVDSTNETVKRENLKTHANVLYCIYAREQTKGKGRFGKSWFSKKDSSILVSFAFKNFQTPYPHQVTQILAYSVAHFLKNFHIPAEIKWPNDLFVGGKKIGGILAEIHGDTIIVGLGLNLNLTEDDLLKVDQPATSYLIEIGRHLFAPEATKVIAEFFLKELNHFKAKGFTSYHKEITEMLYGRHKKAYWIVDGHQKEGTIIALNPEGFLEMKIDGKIQVIQNGSLRIT